ncbi:ATP synthase subunit E [Salipiger sp. CCB-MM3]|uniref:endonuclease n=1 Tax=Salipiger sp. CCB-MM3 TaxID=1792508 RepID=UPI00080AA349|nr:endonuclease [Salipiger sp. CCB-MM3]ANT59367.1 ATP synthase subunit E [Salipiger sp. CCB-MM3]
MTDVTMQDGCARKCWITAAVFGLIVALFALGGGKGFFAAIVLALITAGLLGSLFTWLSCAAVPQLSERSPMSSLAPAVEGEVPTMPDTVTAEPATLMTSQEVPPVEDLPEPAPAAAAAPEPAPAPKEEIPAKPETVAPAATEEEEAQPEALASPRGGEADNLKEIKGVGPKLESLLHELGIYHFDQIAGWSASEVAWMDQNLKGFRGRVSRDDWIGQAKTLAAGGETEFSKRVEEGDVY